MLRPMPFLCISQNSFQTVNVYPWSTAHWLYFPLGIVFYDYVKSNAKWKLESTKLKRPVSYYEYVNHNLSSFAFPMRMDSTMACRLGLLNYQYCTIELFWMITQWRCCVILLLFCLKWDKYFRIILLQLQECLLICRYD